MVVFHNKQLLLLYYLLLNEVGRILTDLRSNIPYDLSESEEINPYFCHLYGSQARCFTDKSVGTIKTAWNKAVRKH